MRVKHFVLASSIAFTACSGPQLSTKSSRSPAVEFAGFKKDATSLKNMIADALKRVKAVNTYNNRVPYIEVNLVGTVQTLHGQERIYSVSIGSVYDLRFETFMGETTSIAVVDNKITFNTGIPIYALDQKGNSILIGENKPVLFVTPTAGFLKSLWPLNSLNGHLDSRLIQIDNGTRFRFLKVPVPADGKFYLITIGAPSEYSGPHVVQDQLGDWKKHAMGACSIEGTERLIGER